MSILSDFRSNLSKLKINEFASVEDQPSLKEMWSRMQELREEMNLAKRNALNEAAKPYMEVIEQIEKRYSVILRLSN